MDDMQNALYGTILLREEFQKGRNFSTFLFKRREANKIDQRPFFDDSPVRAPVY
jgi:hypothetical protein